MLKHIVLWKMKEGVEGRSQKESALKFKQMLEALPAHIPEILEFEVGLPVDEGENVSDISLYSAFKDAAAMKTYQEHPEHLKVIAYAKTVIAERRVVDYFIHN
jgi:hypothetical protein